MRKLPENDCVGLLTSQNDPPNETKSDAIPCDRGPLYQKCVTCPDYGVTCNGPKLSAFRDIMLVRDFHRRIRDTRGIPMKLIHLASQPVSESTVNDYFSHAVKDFKWTTVGAIDYALTAICGNKVGQELPDAPCPASSSEIQQQIGAWEEQVSQLQNENADLQRRVSAAKERAVLVREEVRDDYSSRVQFLKSLSEQRQNDIDALKQEMADQKEHYHSEISRRDDIAADYLKRIDEKNKRIDSLNKANHILVFVLVCAMIALTCYLVWDLIHPSLGLFQY